MLNTMARVSIVVRTKNRPQFLKRALHDIEAQKYRKFEVVVINDGGDPEQVEEVVRSQPGAENWCTVLHNVESEGFASASNKAIQKTTGKYLVLHDDDDTWHPQFLSTCVSYLEECPEGSVKGVATRIEKITEVVDESTGDIREVSREPFNSHIKNVNLFYMIGRNQFAPISFLYERDAGGSLGFYDPSVKYGIDDWDFNIRFLEKYDIGFIPEVLAYYHVRESKNTETSNSSRELMRMYEFTRKNKDLRAYLAEDPGSYGLIAFMSQYLSGIEQKIDELISEQDEQG